MVSARMGFLDRLDQEGYEQVVLYRDPEAGLKAIIAIHDTRRGPALGGVRMWPYASLEDALQDALRLARAMTYKAAVSQLPFGGGKAVIIGDPSRQKRPALLRAFGRLVDSLGGRYITAEDVGMQVADMSVIRRVTPHVTGTSLHAGGSGDPSEMTALGVLAGMRATVEAFDRRGRPPGLHGLRVAIQGLGKVGYRLAELLHAEGASLVVTDLNRNLVRQAVEAFGAEPVSPQAIYWVRCDLFAPCALGGVLNAKTIPVLRCRAVAGAANNQLAEPQDGERLHRRGILYAPDYVINAGGLINIAVEFEPGGYDRARAERRTLGIYETVKRVFRLARAKGRAPAVAADRLAEQRLRSGRRWTGFIKGGQRTWRRKYRSGIGLPNFRSRISPGNR